MTGKSVELTRKNYRVTKIKSHLIFYRKIENDIGEVVIILHQRIAIKKSNRLKKTTHNISYNLYLHLN